MLRTRISTLEACNPEELFSEEARRLVNETLDRLPEKTRAIFIRSRFDGKSYKEIAAEMDVTVKSVEFEVSKACAWHSKITWLFLFSGFISIDNHSFNLLHPDFL